MEELIKKNWSTLFSLYFFQPGSHFHKALPNFLDSLGKINFTLWELIQYTKKFVENEHLLDFNNRTLVVCNVKLGQALDCRGFHFKQLGTILLKQLILLEEREMPKNGCPLSMILVSALPEIENEPKKVGNMGVARKNMIFGPTMDPVAPLGARHATQSPQKCCLFAVSP